MLSVMTVAGVYAGRLLSRYPLSNTRSPETLAVALRDYIVIR